MMNVITKYRVTSDYEKKDSNDNELTLKSGDTVEVLKKGKYIWYGKINNTKGFFPSRIVSEIQNKTSDYTGNILSSTAIIDKKEIIEHTDKTSASMNSETSEKGFAKIDSEPPLEDKRRTRAKSTGRPPSQVFMKGNILRSDSMDNLSTASEDEELEKQQSKDVPDSSSKISQLVSELKKKPSMKFVAQKDNHNDSNPETTSGVPTWMKMIPKKKVSSPAPPTADKKNESPKTIAPWMQEIQRKREHKLSLRSDDETLEKIGQESKASHQNIKHSTVEVNSAVIRKATDEKQIQAKHYNLDTREISSNRSSFQQSTKVVESYSFLQNNIDTKDIPVIGHNENSNKTDSTKNDKVEPTIESNESQEVPTLPVSVAEKVFSSNPGVNLEYKNKSTDKLEASRKIESKEVSKTDSAELSKDIKVASSSTSLTSITVSNSTNCLKKNTEDAVETKTVRLDKHDAISELDKSVSDLLKDATIPADNNAKPNETMFHTENIGKLPKETTIIIGSSSTEKPNELATTKELGETVKHVRMDFLSYSFQKPNETVSENSSVTKMINFSSPAIPKEVISETTEITKSKENGNKHVESKEISGTKEEINIKRNTETEGRTLEQPKVLDNTNNKNDPNSIHLLLKEIEDFNVKHELRSKEIKRDLRKLEMSINQQHEEIKAFIEKAKEKLNALIKT